MNQLSDSILLYPACQRRHFFLSFLLKEKQICYKEQNLTALCFAATLEGFILSFHGGFFQVNIFTLLIFFVYHTCCSIITIRLC